MLANDPACFTNWDAGGRCRQFTIRATSAGRLLVRAELPSPSLGFYDPEIIIVAPDSTWDIAQYTWPIREVSMPVEAGLEYRIVIISYGAFPSTVVVRAEFNEDVPPSGS